MGQSVGDVFINLGLKKGNFDTGTKQAAATFKSFERQMKTAAVGIGTAIASAFSVGAIMKAGKEVLDNADKMAKLSQSTGVAVETLTSFKYAADLSGSSIENIIKGLQALSRNMLSAQAGTGEALMAFRALGIEVEESGKLLSSDAVLGKIADKFSEMEDGAAKTALAMRIFGDSGAELIPLLNAGSAGITEMREEAERLGLVMSKEMAQQAERVNDQMTRLQSMLSGVTIRVMDGLLPTLENLSEVYISTARNTDEMTEASMTLSAVVKSLATGVQVLGSTFKVAGTYIGGTAAAIVAFTKGELSEGLEILEMRNRDIEAETINAFEKINRIWDTETERRLRERHKIEAAYKIPAPSLETPTGTGNNFVTTDWGGVEPWRARQEAQIAIVQMQLETDLAVRDAEGLMATETTRIKNHTVTMADEMKVAITGWGSHFSRTLSDAVWGAELSFRSIAESFGRMITEMIIQKAVVEPLLGSFFGGGGKGFLGGLFGFAEGGTISEPIFGIGKSGRHYLFGEAGAEEVIPHSKISKVSGSLTNSSETTLNVNIIAADARSISDMMRRNPGAIIGPLREALQSGNHGLIGDIRSVV